MESKKKVKGSVLFGLYILFFPCTNGLDPLCPQVLNKIPNLCSRIKCLNIITEEDCPLGTFYTAGLNMCGCCPGCAKYIGFPPDRRLCTNDTVPVTTTWLPGCSGPACPVELDKCMPGLVCEKPGICKLSTEKLDPCTHECLYKKSLNILGLFHYEPKCEADGSYAPKQCKGDPHDGICFCVDRCGKRVFGTQWRLQAQNQTCACSRATSDLRRLGNVATFHCTDQGNFEALQCDTDSGSCFCVDEKTGKLSGAVLPEKLWKTLPCYTLNVTNFQKDGKFLRKCESEYAGAKKLQIDGKLHGTEVNIYSPDCDYDGSFGLRQHIGTRYQCVYKNGTRIKDYMINNIDPETMDCRCARDEYLYQISARPFSYLCQLQTGNYRDFYSFGSFASCVDRDGMAYGDLVPSKYVCCLGKECTFLLNEKCYNRQTNPEGYKPCCYYPFGSPCSQP